MVRKYAAYPDFNKKVDVNDVLEDKAYNIYQFALKYDPSRGMKFGTYVAESTKHLCQNLIYRGTESVQFNEEVAPTNDTSVTETAERDSSIEVALEQVKGSDSAAFRKIFKLRFMGQKPKSWRQIGAALGMSHEGARKTYEKHIGAVKEYLQT
jgi:DNA-directed RNA polymerase sigma subunit (sigma70/sigma32)